LLGVAGSHGQRSSGGAPEYLCNIYRPEYLLPENPERLRARDVGAKRSSASREFALGVEALERFVRKEPLRRVYECVFGALALESEPVDARFYLRGHSADTKTADPLIIAL
jgi:hypothetical protein